MNSSIEKRCARRRTVAFVAPDTLDALAGKMVGIIGDRRMTKMHRYLGKNPGTPSLFPGMTPWHGGYGSYLTRTPYSVSVQLANNRTHEGVGFSVSGDAVEDQVAQNYHRPEMNWLGERRNITCVELSGFPGEPSRDDSIRIEHWNDYGVGSEELVVFDDIDPIQELLWEIKGDVDRRVYMDHDWCLHHEQHYDDPHHKYQGNCEARPATLAEDLALLAKLAKQAEGA